jgi:hypothetical protein
MAAMQHAILPLFGAYCTFSSKYQLCSIGRVMRVSEGDIELGDLPLQLV